MSGLILFASRMTLALVFGVAALAKCASIKRTGESLTEFGVPHRFALVTAATLAVAELIVAAGLLISRAPFVAALAAFALLSLFSVVIAANLLRSRRPQCNCFGQLHAEPISRTTLARTAMLACLALYLTTLARSPDAASDGWLDVLQNRDWVLVGFGLSVLCAGGVLGALLVQVIHQQGRMLVRLDALGLALGVEAETPEPSRLPIGGPAPDFTLSDVHGERRTLASLRRAGRKLLLIFVHPGCGPCSAIVPQVEKWRQAHERSLDIVVISQGSTEDNREFASQDDVLLQDVHEVSDAYGTNATPSAVLIDAQGNIAHAPAVGEAAIQQLLGRLEGRQATLSVPSHQIAAEVPEIALKTATGEVLSLKDLRGRPSVLLFFNLACGFCQRMLPELRAWASRRTGGPRLLLALVHDAKVPPPDLQLDATVILDEDSHVAEAFGAHGTPMAVLLDEEGRVASDLAAGAHAFFALAGRGEPQIEVQAALTQGSQP